MEEEEGCSSVTELLNAAPHTVVSLGVGPAVDHLSNPTPTLVACAGSAKKDEHLPGLERGHKDLIHQ